ncbi:sporulation membrane protein YtrI [Guptibacillus hwajinpoensis]|uniref:sporulation membrane protein YtrI n=1 Tax=Guptibacillus hwajinpoensis TaxID=208199 RepID=UPI001CFD3CB0|nr:sporulation membrane protein YtrI [Pseudalkalibacillus hwajinpoensis]WLR60813.1 sporulation protein [Pseudalkalibacillus hwajinpoensis]
MRVPQIYSRKGWQRFLAGLSVGVIFGWLFFLMLFGIMYEKQITTIKEQKIEISDLKTQNQTLLDDQENYNNKEIEKTLLVKKIDVTFEKNNDLPLNSLTRHELKKEIQTELNDLLNKDLGTISRTRSFIIQSLENKTLMIDNIKYGFKVKQFILWTTVEVVLTIELVQ